jgi:hypothetical protein
MAVLAGAFIAEGLWVYVHQLQRFTTAVLRLGIGALLVVGLSRTLGDLRWLVLTVPAGLAGHALLTHIYLQAV